MEHYSFMEHYSSWSRSGEDNTSANLAAPLGVVRDTVPAVKEQMHLPGGIFAASIRNSPATLDLLWIPLRAAHDRGFRDVGRASVRARSTIQAVITVYIVLGI
jgi:hypothetical protein